MLKVGWTLYADRRPPLGADSNFGEDRVKGNGNDGSENQVSVVRYPVSGTRYRVPDDWHCLPLDGETDWPHRAVGDDPRPTSS